MIRKCAVKGCNKNAHRDLPPEYQKYCAECGNIFWDVDLDEIMNKEDVKK